MFASPESQRRIRILLFLTPFCLGIYQWYRLPPLGNGYEPVDVARSLVEHGTFADPFGNVVTGPSAHLAPAFPFSSGLMWLFGYTLAFALSAVAINAAMHGLHGCCCPVCRSSFSGAPRRVFGPRYLCPVARRPVSSRLGGHVFRRWPMLFCLVSARLLGPGRGAPANALACGAMCGLLCLINPVAPAVCYPWIVVLLVRLRGPPARGHEPGRPGARDHAGLFSLEPAQLSGVPPMVLDSRQSRPGAVPLQQRPGLLQRRRQQHAGPAPRHAIALQPLRSRAHETDERGGVDYRERMAIAVDWIRRHPSALPLSRRSGRSNSGSPTPHWPHRARTASGRLRCSRCRTCTDGGAEVTRYVVYRARIRALSAGLLPGRIQHALPLSDPVVVPAARGLLPGPRRPVGPGPLPASATPSP